MVFKHVVVDMLKDEKIMRSKAARYDPKANGRAEKYVGTSKQHATSYLIRA